MAGGEMAAEAAKFWGLLNQLQEKDPDQYDKVIGQTLREGRELFGPPEPGCCLKLLIQPMYNCGVLYLNICQWTRVPKPPNDHAPVAVKGGTLRHKLNQNQKTNELIYDLAINPEVFAEVSRSAELEEMLIQLCFDFIRDIAKVSVVDRKNYTKLKESFIGNKEDLQFSIDEDYKKYLPQNTRADFGESIIKEISKLSTSEEQSSDDIGLAVPEAPPQTTPPLIEELSSSPAKPDYTLVKTDTALTVSVLLPGVKSTGDVQLDVSKDSLSVEASGFQCLSLDLPASVNEENTRASFKTRTSTLHITMPLL